jgi:hypothetical protein
VAHYVGRDVSIAAHDGARPRTRDVRRATSGTRRGTRDVGRAASSALCASSVRATPDARLGRATWTRDLDARLSTRVGQTPEFDGWMPAQLHIVLNLLNKMGA